MWNEINLSQEVNKFLFTKISKGLNLGKCMGLFKEKFLKLTTKENLKHNWGY